MNYLEINRKVYDSLAEEYEERIKRYAEKSKEISRLFIEIIKQRFQKPNILELDAGAGLALKYFEEQGFKTTGIDISPKMIEVAKKTSLNSKLILGDFLEQDFNNLKFDGIFARAFIHLFPKKDALLVLKKIHSLLSDKGIVFIGTSISEQSEEGYFEKKDYKRKLKRFKKKWKKDELKEAVTDSGFKIIKILEDFEADLDKFWFKLILEKA